MGFVRCEHDVYLSPSDVASGKSWGCQQCYPEGHPETSQEPILSRNSIETKQLASTDCTRCGCVRTYSSPNCRSCGQPFPELVYDDSSNARNNPGACPVCGSTSHYETKRRSFWQCVECLKEYRAPKGIVGEDTDD